MDKMMILNEGTNGQKDKKKMKKRKREINETLETRKRESRKNENILTRAISTLLAHRERSTAILIA